jgi:hypothetical protein
VERVDTRFGHHDILPMRAFIGGSVFGGVNSGLFRRLLGAGLGAGINSPTTMSRGAIAFDSLAKQVPGLTRGAQVLARVDQTAPMFDEAVREAVLKAMEQNTEKP